MSNSNNITIANNAKAQTEKIAHNLRIYEGHRSVPAEAKKPITAGDLKGMTDINPMWRIKSLTEEFGPVGEGWYFEPIKEETIPLIDGRIIYTVDIHLFYKLDNGEWSKPVFGTGGGTLVTFRYEKLYIDDDAKKKALTDAISVCCKELGFGAEVYWDKDFTKYGLGDFAPVQIPMLPTVETMNAITGDDNSVNNGITANGGNVPNNTKMPDAMAAVNSAIQSQTNNANAQPDTKQFIRIDPATTPVPTLEEAESYMIAGNGKWTGHSLGQVFRLAMSGDKQAQYWINWLYTADTTSENIAWAQFYANFLNNYYRQMAQGQGTADNNANA